MNTFFTIILTTCCYLASSAQIDLENPPWETGCDSLTTQTEMNICSYEKLQIADSILNSYYDSLIKFVDSLYQTELKETPRDKFQKDLLEKLRRQKDAIIKSRIDFRRFRNSTTDIIAYEYQGGTIQPLEINTYALELTVNQIKIIISLMDEIIERY